MAYAPRPHRPLGVAILAVLIGIVGVLYALFGLLVVFAVALSGAVIPHLPFLGAGLVAGVVLLLFGVLLVIIASGLWGLELWALVLCLIVVGFLWISDVLAGAILSFGGVVLLLLLVYLLLVRHHFR